MLGRRPGRSLHPAAFVFSTHHDPCCQRCSSHRLFGSRRPHTRRRRRSGATQATEWERRNKIVLTHETTFPAFCRPLVFAFYLLLTRYLSQRRPSTNSLGLAPYGEPTYYERFRAHRRPEGRRLRSVSTLVTFKLLHRSHDDLGKVSTGYFGGLHVAPTLLSRQHGQDICRVVQKVIEANLCCAQARHACTLKRGLKNRAWQGALPLNSSATGASYVEETFENVWRAAGGGTRRVRWALLSHWHQLLDQPRRPRRPTASKGGAAWAPLMTSDRVCCSPRADRSGVSTDSIRTIALRFTSAGLVADGSSCWFGMAHGIRSRALVSR